MVYLKRTHPSLLKMNLPSMMKMGNQLILTMLFYLLLPSTENITPLRWLKDYTGTFVKISGSSIGEKDGKIYATDTLNFRKGQGGARWTMYKRGGEDGSGWDSSDAPNSWYGAGAIRMSGPNNSVTVGAISSTLVMPESQMPVVSGKDNTEAKDQTFGIH